MTKEAKKEAKVEKAVNSQLGKRYRCQVCGTEILCVKSGPNVASCCGQEVVMQQPKAIPSSD